MRSKMESMQKRFWADDQPLVERLGRDFFRQLPEKPGVYLMHSPADVVLYVGKAKSLRHRLGSYRVANPERMARRTLRLLRLVAKIAWEECADEAAALRRESELLLSLKPRFNRAGVWQGSERFLGWRVEADDFELAVLDKPEAGWNCAGPFRGKVVHLHRALVRLFWLRFYPDVGLAGMPSGWFDGLHGPYVKFLVPEKAFGDSRIELVSQAQPAGEGEHSTFDIQHLTSRRGEELLNETRAGSASCEHARPAGLLSRCNDGLLRLVGDGVVELDAWVPGTRRTFEKTVWEEDMEFVSKHLAGRFLKATMED